IERIERDPQGLALAGVELGVHHAPRPAHLVPDFANPVVLETRWVEVRAEAAPRAGRRASGAQERAEQHREMAAVADEASLGRAWLIERPRIEREHALEQLCRRAGRQLVVTKHGWLEAVTARRDRDRPAHGADRARARRARGDR